jgi:hypothetical protein
MSNSWQKPQNFHLLWCKLAGQVGRLDVIVAAGEVMLMLMFGSVPGT